MENFWKSAITITGFAGVAAFVFWSLYKDWLTLPIFEKLTSKQTFILMLIFLILTFCALIFMLIMHFAFKKKTNVGIKNSKFVNIEQSQYLQNTCNQLWHGLPHNSIMISNLDNQNQIELIKRIKKRVREEGNSRGYHFEIVELDTSEIREDEFFNKLNDVLKRTLLIQNLYKIRTTNDKKQEPFHLLYSIDNLPNFEKLQNKLVLILSRCDESFPNYNSSIFGKLRALTQMQSDFSIVILSNNKDLILNSGAGRESVGSSLLNIFSFIEPQLLKPSNT